jgi:3-oxoacyl-[acyl-carrier protein] reductase
MPIFVISGGTGGLGGTVVERLKRDGRCVVLYRTTFPADLDIEGVQCDVESPASVRDAFATIGGGIHAVVHLAGAWEGGTLLETSDQSWARMLSLNVTSAFLLAREAMPRMPNGGRFIAISSAATLHPSSGMAAYTVAKSALNTLVRVVAAEGRSKGITANALLPTGLATKAMMESGDRSKLVPLEHVAETIAFLLSPEGASITGALIEMRP